MRLPSEASNLTLHVPQASNQSLNTSHTPEATITFAEENAALTQAVPFEAGRQNGVYPTELIQICGSEAVLSNTASFKSQIMGTPSHFKYGRQLKINGAKDSNG